MIDQKEQATTESAKQQQVITRSMVQHAFRVARRTKPKTMLKIAGSGTLAVAGLAFVMPFLGTVMLCSLAVGAVAFLATMGYAAYFMRTKLPAIFPGNGEKP